MPAGYTDLADLPEDERIRVIAHHVQSHGLTVGVFLDHEPGKAERYTKKLEKLGCRVLQQVQGPVANVVTLKVAPANIN